MRRKIIGFSLVAMFVVWAAAALIGMMGQRKLFCEQGEEELYDFWMPRMCLEQGYVGRPEQYTGFVDVRHGKPIEFDERDVVRSDWYTNGKETLFITGWRDKVYTPIAILPFGLFPATRFGGYLWSVLAGLLFLGALCLVSRSWWPVLLAMSMPFIFSVERGNPVWISAACVGIFLAWWDDEKEWKRLVAAACLAVAGAMKIAPFALGALYFTRWRWRPVLLCGFLSLLLVFVPWFFISDGFAALPIMIRNAAEHSQSVQRASDFGLVQFWRTFRLIMGQCVQEAWPGMKAVAILSQLTGVVVLVVGARRRDYLLLVGGMLWAAGNMYYYAMLYVLAVLVLELSTHETTLRPLQPRVAALKDPETLSLLLWLALLCPIQIVLLGHSANQVIGNVVLMGLMTIRLMVGGNCLAAKNAETAKRFEPRNTEIQNYTKREDDGCCAV